MSQINPMSPLLRLKEAASLLNCSVKTVRRLIDSCQIVAHRRGRSLVIKTEVLKRFINDLSEGR